MEEKVLGYGVIGTGVYCDHYFGTLGPVFKNLRPVGCSDLNVEAAKAAAARWNVPKVYTTEEMLADPEVDIVIILTNPASHYSLTMAALKAGKHVYCEKPWPRASSRPMRSWNLPPKRASSWAPRPTPS